MLDARKKRLVAALCSLLLAVQPLQTLAAVDPNSLAGVNSDFRPEAVLNDADIFDVNGMSHQQLIDFLRTHGTLYGYRTKDIDGQEKYAADIIWRVANSYKINPKYLLALLQKEQGLVDDPSPTQKQFDWATGFGICDSCSMDDPSLQQFKGFASQLEWAAKQHREKYLLQLLGRGSTLAGISPGKPTVIDGQTIVPVNNATAMLYTYTPHLQGNLNLWRIWQRWFALIFPDGTVVRGTSSNTYYLIRFGERRPFKDFAAMASMQDPSKALQVEDSQLARYPIGKPISFANYSLVELPNGKRYLLVGDQKRLIVSRKVFYKVGFNEDEVIPAKPADLSAYGDGPDITSATAYPAGRLAKDKAHNYWYLEDGVRELIPNRAFLALYFYGQPAKLMTDKQLQKFTLGTPYQLHDAELVRETGDSAVYVIENGKRRPIPSAEMFVELGWNWKNVVALPADVLETYPIGDPVQAHEIIQNDNPVEITVATTTLAVAP